MKKKGFSLVEVMFVAAIISLLLGYIFPLIDEYRSSVENSRLRANFNTTYKAINSAIINEGKVFPWVDDTSNVPRGLSFNGYNTNFVYGGGATYDDEGNLLTPATEAFYFLKKLGEFLPEDITILSWDDNGNSYPFVEDKYNIAEDKVFDYFMPQIPDPPNVTEGTRRDFEVNLVASGNQYENTYTRRDGEVISIRFSEPDSRPDTYSVIFVYKELLRPANTYQPYQPHLFSTENVDIILYNEGYYSINGGELIKAITSTDFS